MRLSRGIVCGLALLGAACSSPAPGSETDEGPESAAITSDASAATSPIRLTGTVEAVQARAVAVPRLQGPLTPLLIISLVPAGTRVEPGDPLVEFDPQQQIRNAFDRQAELVNLEGEIEKTRAEQRAVEAKDLTELEAARNDVERARLEVRKNDLLPRIDAEKNTLALDQALARLEQLETTFELKRRAEAADLEIVEIRRERAERALRYARDNAQRMEVRSPFRGLVVIKRMFRDGTFVEIAEGDEVRPGTPVVDIVDTSAMRVRARLNQADLDHVRIGQPARIGLDGFPDLSFTGTVLSVTPLATPSRLAETVRTFTAIVSIDGTDPQLLPDLSAWVEVVPSAASAVAGVP